MQACGQPSGGKKAQLQKHLQAAMKTQPGLRQFLANGGGRLRAAKARWLSLQYADAKRAQRERGI